MLLKLEEGGEDGEEQDDRWGNQQHLGSKNMRFKYILIQDGKKQFGNLNLKTVDHCFQKTYDIPCSTYEN